MNHLNKHQEGYKDAVVPRAYDIGVKPVVRRHPPASHEKEKSSDTGGDDMFPLYAFFLNAFCSEARYGKQHQREPFGVIGIIEHTAIVDKSADTVLL